MTCAAALAAGLAFTGAAAHGAPTKHTDCTWGASSVTATYENGKLVQSPPATTGCTP